jgi:DNA helicase-2/ATP-dependent DNA helicase PcrA
MLAMPSRFLKVITPSLAERGKTSRARAEGRGAFGGGGYGGAPRDGDSSWGRSSYAGGNAGASGAARRPAGPYGSSGYGSSNFGTGASKGDIPFGRAPVGGFSAPNRRERLPEPEDESQDAPMFRPGERVKHAKFGTGTIAELTGSGRDAKVRIDFDDAEVGRKTLVLAQAKLERGWE